MVWRQKLKQLNIDENNYYRPTTLLNHKGCVELTTNFNIEDKTYTGIIGDACTKTSVREEISNLMDRALENAYFKALSLHFNKDPRQADNRESTYVKYQGLTVRKRMTYKIVRTRFRYYKNGTRFKTVVRNGKEYEYLFSKKTGRILTYGRRKETEYF